MLDYPDRVACIAFTPGCSMRCGFCHNPEFVVPEQIRALESGFIATETFFNFLDQRRGLLEGVVVSGGEPTIWPDLPDFMREIQARGFLTKLDTNGRHPEMLERLLSEGLVDYVAMDVKTSLSNYPKLVGPAIRPESIKESINFLKSNRIEYEFRCTLIKELHPPPILEQMADLMKDAKQIFLQSFRNTLTLKPSFSKFHAFTEQEMKKAVEIFLKKTKRVSVREA